MLEDLKRIEKELVKRQKKLEKISTPEEIHEQKLSKIEKTYATKVATIESEIEELEKMRQAETKKSTSAEKDAIAENNRNVDKKIKSKKKSLLTAQARYEIDLAGLDEAVNEQVKANNIAKTALEHEMLELKKELLQAIQETEAEANKNIEQAKNDEEDAYKKFTEQNKECKKADSNIQKLKISLKDLSTIENADVEIIRKQVWTLKTGEMERLKEFAKKRDELWNTYYEIKKNCKKINKNSETTLKTAELLMEKYKLNEIDLEKIDKDAVNMANDEKTQLPETEDIEEPDTIQISNNKRLVVTKQDVKQLIEESKEACKTFFIQQGVKAYYASTLREKILQDIEQKGQQLQRTIDELENSDNYGRINDYINTSIQNLINEQREYIAKFSNIEGASEIASAYLDNYKRELENEALDAETKSAISEEYNQILIDAHNAQIPIKNEYTLIAEIPTYKPTIKKSRRELSKNLVNKTEDNQNKTEIKTSGILGKIKQWMSKLVKKSNNTIKQESNSVDGNPQLNEETVKNEQTELEEIISITMQEVKQACNNYLESKGVSKDGTNIIREILISAVNTKEMALKDRLRAVENIEKNNYKGLDIYINNVIADTSKQKDKMVRGLGDDQFATTAIEEYLEYLNTYIQAEQTTKEEKQELLERYNKIILETKQLNIPINNKYYPSRGKTINFVQKIKQKISKIMHKETEPKVENTENSNATEKDNFLTRIKVSQETINKSNDITQSEETNEQEITLLDDPLVQG